MGLYKPSMDECTLLHGSSYYYTIWQYLQYASSDSPYYPSTPQPPQPPQLTYLVKQAILNLSKLVDTFIEEQRALNVQANQKIDIVESSLEKRINGLQREIDQKFDNLQKSISRLTN